MSKDILAKVTEDREEAYDFILCVARELNYESPFTAHLANRMNAFVVLRRPPCDYGGNHRAADCDCNPYDTGEPLNESK
jgi:hypothetical protein